jgi:hypothetical protein
MQLASFLIINDSERILRGLATGLASEYKMVEDSLH